MFRDIAPMRYVNEEGDASDIAGVPVGGDLTGTLPNPSLIPLHAGGGPVGDSGNVPVITWDSKGRVLSVTPAPITATGNAFKAFLKRKASGPAGPIPNESFMQSDTLLNVGFVTVTPTTVTIPVTGLLHYYVRIYFAVGAGDFQRKSLYFYRVGETPGIDNIAQASSENRQPFQQGDTAMTLDITAVFQVTVGEQYVLMFVDESPDPQAGLVTAHTTIEYWTIF